MNGSGAVREDNSLHGPGTWRANLLPYPLLSGAINVHHGNTRISKSTKRDLLTVMRPHDIVHSVVRQTGRGATGDIENPEASVFATVGQKLFIRGEPEVPGVDFRGDRTFSLALPVKPGEFLRPYKACLIGQDASISGNADGRFYSRVGNAANLRHQNGWFSPNLARLLIQF